MKTTLMSEQTIYQKAADTLRQVLRTAKPVPPASAEPTPTEPVKPGPEGTTN